MKWVPHSGPERIGYKPEVTIYSLEFAGLGCYITAMLTGRGWMLRITVPILG